MPPQSQTPAKVIYIVVTTLALLSIIGLTSLAGTLFFRAYTDPAVLTAFISLTSGSIGALGTVLVNTRQTTSSDQAPSPVTIKQPDTQPVPVTEIQKQ